MTCGKCKAPTTEADAEVCWYCTGPLCYVCWDETGHCGHPEAEAINEASRRGEMVTMPPDAFDVAFASVK